MRIEGIVLVSALLGWASLAGADKVVLKSGTSYEVLGFEMTSAAIKMITPDGKAWSVVKDIVDVPATLKANGMSETDTRSPGWVARSPGVAARPEGAAPRSAKVGPRTVPAEPAAPSSQSPEVDREIPNQKKQADRDRRAAEKAVEKDEEAAEKQGKAAERERKATEANEANEANEERKAAEEREAAAPIPPPAQATFASGAPSRASRRAAPPIASVDERTLTPFVVSLNGGYSGTALDFTSSSSFVLHLEDASLASRYTGSTGPVVEVGGLYRFRGPWAAGASVELFAGKNDAALSASLPHPLYFDRPRTLQGAIPSLDYRETSLNLNLVYSHALGRRIILDGFGGPTLFWTRSQLLTDIQYVDAFPYDRLTLQAPIVTEQTDMPIGFNVGTGMTFRLKGWLGVGLLVRYNRAAVQLPQSDGSLVSFNAGGLRANGGIRLLFK